MLADWLFVVVWLVGLAGTFVPVLPATLIVLAGVLLHEILTGFAEISRGIWLWLAVLTLLVFALDNLAGLLGAKRYGASRAGVWGSFIGGLLGFFVVPPWGLLFMPFVGAFVAEAFSGRKPAAALRAAYGALVGMLGGMAGKFFLHLVMGILVLRAIF